MDKSANTSANLIAPIKERWSPRAFDANKTLEDTDLKEIFEAARWAPSCFNEQPWRFMAFGRDAEQRSVVESALNEGNAWAKEASHLVVIAASTEFGHNGKPNRHAFYDTGAAVISLIYQAQTHGIASHQMAGFNRDQLEKDLHCPDKHEFVAVLALGYECENKEKSVLNETLLEKEKAPRQRKDLNQIVSFNQGWHF